MALEKHTLADLKHLIESGHTYRLFKPFLLQGQVLLNIEKILTIKDIDKLDGKIYGPIEVVPTTVHNTNDKVRKSLISTIVNILKTSPLFYIDEKKHLNFEKRKECEKLINGIIDASPHLAMLLIELYKRSKKIFVHSVNVGIIATVLDLGIQENTKHHDGLRSEIILTGALLHDIAYIKIPETMLNKRRIEYTEEEKKIYNDHPKSGQENN